MIAHKRKKDGKEQSILEHSENTARLCAENMKPTGCTKLAELTALIHDMGKLTEAWQQYLHEHYKDESKEAPGEKLHHAPVGAIFAFERWYDKNDLMRCITAQLIVMAVYGHHSGLMDAISVDKTSPLLKKMRRNKSELFYNEAVENFFAEVCPPEKLDGLFEAAVDELRSIKDKLNRFSAGLLLRSLLGALVDADRLDSACFEYGEKLPKKNAPADWPAATEALEKKLNEFPKDKSIDITRQKISFDCFVSANKPRGVYSLTVPTGGGKTFASLRFALRHAEINGLEHIFYIIPFNTILDQNAKDIRDALKNTDVNILEHHSSVVFDDETAENEIVNHKRLTERWKSDIVLTSMVQFLNAFYSRKNADARRLSGLFSSVIIFDEIQALPKKCTQLFEKTVKFLTELCGCTVVLCTATQPQLKLEPEELMPNRIALFERLRRTTIIDETGISRSTERAADDIEKLMAKYGSVLMIVNTKKMAQRLYELALFKKIPCVHLSTNMYPEHRLRIIERIKKRPKNEPLLCVSTALIEAGINISFPCVVRSLAGLGSILQSAGRCNRNAELANGDVYIWRLSDESLKCLPEIETAQECTLGILASRGAQSADSPETIDAYYAIERDAFKSFLPYPEQVDGVDVRLLNLLGENGKPNGSESDKLALRGAYRKAEELFCVIPGSFTVLVERGRGAEIAARLAGDLVMNEKIKLLREAQSYSISLFKNTFDKLFNDMKAIYKNEDAGVYILRGEYYNDDTGLTMQAQLMELMEY